MDLQCEVILGNILTGPQGHRAFETVRIPGCFEEHKMNGFSLQHCS
jgi:hypothetical protein